MLVLTRKVGERIVIGDGVVVTVVRIQNDKVRLGVEAPRQVAVHREEVFRRIHAGPAPGPRNDRVGTADGPEVGGTLRGAEST